MEGNLRPSSDLATHLLLYRQFPAIGGIAHTHSEFATAWAQASRPFPCFGTTHADYFHGPVPVTDTLTSAELSTTTRRIPGLRSAAFLRMPTRWRACGCWSLDMRRFAGAAPRGGRDAQCRDLGIRGQDGILHARRAARHATDSSANCTISISCANTASRPITDRRRQKHEPASALVTANQLVHLSRS